MSKYKRFLVEILFVLVSAILLFSLGLHSVQVSHDHSGEQHKAEGDALVLGEYMHAAEKKLLVILASLLLLGTGIATLPFGGWPQFISQIELRYLVFFRKRKEVLFTFFGYLLLCFGRGILHPKLH
jgi:hypothetical protein